MKDLYRMGVFQPENAAQASLLLSNMDFSGIGLLREQVAALAKQAAPQVCADAPVQGEKGAPAPSKDLLTRAFEKAEELREQAAGGMEL